MKRRRSAYDIVEEAYDELENLKPTKEEIDAFAKLKEETRQAHGVVTYSESYGELLEDRYFLRLHDTWRGKYWGSYPKRMGRVHIDVGYVDKEMHDRDLVDTVHLMLDQWTAPEFIDFIENRRRER